MNYAEKIEAELQHQSVLFFEKNESISENYLYLPGNITDILSEEVGEYLNAFIQQKLYQRTLLGRIELLLENAKREYQSAADIKYAELTSGTTKLSETAKERLVNADVNVKQLYYNFIDYKKKKEILEICIQNIEDAIFLLSREVTRRSNDISNENRGYNVNNTNLGNEV